MKPARPLLFFDGVCGLCNGFVDWVIARDPDAHFRFSPLQGATAAEQLPETDRTNLDSVVLVIDGSLFRASDAVIEILSRLGRSWRVLATLLRLVPRPLRDASYRLIAKSRYRIFGRKEMCRIPDAAERARFLD